jgi:ribosome-associated heat shock protein Hsp15
VSSQLAGAPDKAGQRVDKWLWHARVVRTRAAAAELVAAGKVRVNRRRIEKAGYLLAIGDVLTIGLGARVRVLRVKVFNERRGPPDTAMSLFEEVATLSVAAHPDDP